MKQGAATVAETRPAPARAGKGRYRVEAVDRALDVLECFTATEAELSLAEIARRTGIPRPTAFRILATLQDRGFVRQAERGGPYALGFGVVALAQVRLRQTSVRELAIPAMRRARDAANETVALCIRDGDHRVHIEQAESHHPIRQSYRLGQRAPLHIGAAGKVLLAALTDAEVESYLARVPRPALSPTTIVDAARLRAEIARIRARGYAESRNEFATGAAAVAAPIRNHAGETVAALQISGPESRWTPAARGRCAAEALAAAGAISEALGAPPTLSPPAGAAPRRGHSPKD